MFEAYKSREVGKNSNYSFKKKLLETQILKLLEADKNPKLDENLIKAVKAIFQICSASELTSGFLRLKGCVNFAEKNKLKKVEMLEILAKKNFTVLKSFFYTDYKMILIDEEGKPYDWNPRKMEDWHFILAAAKANNFPLLKSYISELNKVTPISAMNLCFDSKRLMLKDGQKLSPIFVRKITYEFILNSAYLRCASSPYNPQNSGFEDNYEKLMITESPTQSYYEEDDKNENFFQECNESFNAEIKVSLCLERDKEITREEIETYINKQVLAQPFLKINEETLEYATENFGENTKNDILEIMKEALNKATKSKFLSNVSS